MVINRFGKGGDAVKKFECPYSEFPVFIRAGSILPLKVENEFSGMGTNKSKGFVTILIVKPLNGSHVKDVHEFQSHGYRIVYDYSTERNEMDVYISAHPTNRFIILLKEINASPMVVKIKHRGENAGFEKLGEHSNGEQFWQSSGVSSVFKPTLTKAFIKIVNRANFGLHVRIKNFS